MIKDNKSQKLRLLTEWMDYFILENKEEIKRSIVSGRTVFLQKKMENENYHADFGLMLVSNQEVDLTLKLTINSGEDEGKSCWFNIVKRQDTGVVLFNEKVGVTRIVRYQLKSFLQYASHQAFAHLEDWMEEAEENRKVTEAHEKEAEMVIRESIMNFYLDRGDFESLRLMFPEKKEDIKQEEQQ